MTAEQPSGIHVELVDPQRVMLEEIADSRMKRDDVALTYAFALRQRADVDWGKVNRAIIDRWSLAALQYIKAAAWKRYLEPSPSVGPGGPR